ncbi:receptor-like protein kinase FERONIA [Manihot esculenta]|uniref:Protein kinase domain-containing protein n=1 Tax=Manihot esculenta TaxID=3983 RepID=A0A2C9WKS4_MANES|nr:receptor-like protein kinase FERONIA [Manihot esculenta]OAY60303.1 hypothetical protein MANES_01G102400v8 [Manihot esculenta]
MITLLLLVCIFVSTAAQNSSPYTPTDLILINSGSSSDDASQDGRRWNGDAQSKFCPFNSQTSPPSGASQQHPSVDRVPYMTARVIHSKLTCTFPVLPGPKFIRLYFYPDTYSGLNTSASFFTVTANNYTLLSNFSAYLAVFAQIQARPYLFKEFIVTVWDNQELELTFTPSPGSFAFINGIEIVSIPNGLYSTDMANLYTFVNSESNPFFFFDNSTSLETVYRLNVGGGLVANINDTGMFRTWYDDSNYIFGGPGLVHKWRDDVTIKYTEDTPAYTAPATVYISKRSMGAEPSINLNYNLTWRFPVDSGFNYLVRLHFCETENFITGESQRIFFIFINNMTAEEEADVFHWSGGKGIPVHRDYVIAVPGGSPSNQDLWLALHPNNHSHPIYADAILNGLEILKLNDSDGNLAGPNPELPAPPEPHPISEGRTKRKGSSHVVVIVGAVVGVVFALTIVLLFSVYRRKPRAKDKSSRLPFSYTPSSFTTTSALPTDLCHKFTIAEIRGSTRNFDDQAVIGSGGFGTVYKAYIENGSIPVAIKRLDSTSKQGIREFHTEIEMLSNLRHAHLVSLIGYCDDEGEMILVYEYMQHGNLRDHLYNTKSPPFPWRQRLQICIGAARGLHYLHTGAKYVVIHRDVKSSNILLDRNWVAKVSDFGLSRKGPTGEDQTHVSTAVRGSFGYLDPEYYRRQQLNEKSDVYSFGVVLFEVLCARQPVISHLTKEEIVLVDWARKHYRKGALDQIIDPKLKGDIKLVSLNKFGEIADSCLRDTPTERPTMCDVVWGLEFALQLQETAEKIVDGAVIMSEDQMGSSVTREVITKDDDDEAFTVSGGPMSDSRTTISIGERNSSNKDDEELRSRTVFSEIVNPQGR